MAAWEAPRRAAGAPFEAPTPPPAPTPGARENRVHAVLATLCLMILGRGLWAVYRAAGDWDHFVEVLRRLLG